MPSKNAIKKYVENGYYHIYNRGVEKRDIFMNEKDYGVFLGYLKEYLLPIDTEGLQNKLASPKSSYREKEKILRALNRNNFSDEITLLAYCLMPNHFHLLLKQKGAYTIEQFMRSLCTRYSIYFNKRHKRVGSLFQSVYKAVLVEEEKYFLHLSHYIHSQALAAKGESLRRSKTRQKQPSSLSEYTGSRTATWIKPKEILTHFSKTNKKLSYLSFIKQKTNHRHIPARYKIDH